MYVVLKGQKARPGQSSTERKKVGIATRYRLDGPEIEFQWGPDFPHLSRPALGLPSLLYNGYWVSSPGAKQPGRGVDHSPPSSAEVKERVELCPYSASGLSWLVPGQTLSLLEGMEGNTAVDRVDASKTTHR